MAAGGETCHEQSHDARQIPYGVWAGNEVHRSILGRDRTTGHGVIAPLTMSAATVRDRWVPLNDPRGSFQHRRRAEDSPGALADKLSALELGQPRLQVWESVRATSGLDFNCPSLSPIRPATEEL